MKYAYSFENEGYSETFEDMIFDTLEEAYEELADMMWQAESRDAIGLRLAEYIPNGEDIEHTIRYWRV